MTDSAMEAEFDVLASWTMDAVLALGADHAIPAACRGTASPAALAWLGEACELAEGARLLDVGAGLGGPAAYAAERFGVRPVLVEPMVGACRAARRLFDHPVLAGSGERLPLATGSADVTWCLGVLDTTKAKSALLAELHRVTRRGAPVGLFVLVANRPVVDPPEGNAFPDGAELTALLDRAALDVVQRVPAAELSATPLSWQQRIDRVEVEIDRAHGTDPRYAQAQRQEKRIAALFEDGTITGWLVHAVTR